MQEKDFEKIPGARREELRGRKAVRVLGGFFLNEPLAEVTEIYSFFLNLPWRAQDVALKTHSLECPPAPGL